MAIEQNRTRSHRAGLTGKVKSMRSAGPYHRRFVCLCSIAGLVGLSTPLRADSTLNAYLPPLGYNWPANHSGTNGSVVWGGDTGQNKYHWIQHVVLKVNGETAVDLTWPPPDEFPYNTNVQGSLTFDSTHFADGSTLTFVLTVTDNLSNVRTATNSSCAYNKAFVYGNVSPTVVQAGIGDLSQGSAAATDVSARLGPTNHTVTPSGSTAQITQQKAAITSALPIYTVFYGWSHGTSTGGDALGDSAAHGADNAAQIQARWFLAGEVYNAVYNATNGKTVYSLPPYNFVFLDSCNLASANMAGGFNVSGTAMDRAYLGWPTAMADDLHNESWTNRLYQNLASGYTLADAITQANLLVNGGKAHDGTFADVNPVTIGDPSYKLHGVYGSVSPSTLWHL